MNNNKILIAGGAGFLGSHLCDAYIKKGFEVYVIDNLCTGSLANIFHLKNRSDFVFIKHDICKKIPRSISNIRFNIIVNLASPASPPQYQKLALETLDVGSNGTKNLIELAKKHDSRFFQASTSEVYGDPEIHPQPESYKGRVNSYGPRAMYDESKRFAEALIYVYHYKYKVNTAIVRIFNTYGPRMDPNDGRVVSNLIVQALQNKPLTIYGKGEQTRSFCYVSDLIDGFIRFIESNEEGPINIGNPGEFTILELANKVLEITNSDSKLIHEPLPGDDPTQRKPDISHAIELLKWTPKIGLDEGLKRTIEYFATIIKR